jgi:hypothetical protein
MGVSIVFSVSDDSASANAEHRFLGGGVEMTKSSEGERGLGLQLELLVAYLT